MWRIPTPLMRRTGLLATICAACFAARAWSASGATTVRELEHGGVKRSYRLHLPCGKAPERLAALLLVFHGGGGNAAQIERSAGFSALADARGFVAVYPESIEKNWNDGRVFEQSRAHREKIDDVGFVAAIVESLAKEFAIDRSRVYATGISNGGFFSLHLAAKRADLFSGVAAVTATLSEATAREFAPARPVRILIVNGTKDPLVPYEGGSVALGRGKCVSTDETIAKWVKANGCAEQPKVEDLPDAAPDDGTKAKRITYSGGKAEVALIRIENGGHTWPGGTQYLPEALVGKVSRDFDATRVIWGFFSGEEVAPDSAKHVERGPATEAGGKAPPEP